MSEEYDLKKSVEKIGYLYPVILSADGEPVDGFHRLAADPNWRTEVNENLDSTEKVLKAKLISNKFRRQVSAEEVKGWINELGEIALNDHEIERGKISGWIAEETGYSDNRVRELLEDKYKIITSPLGVYTKAKIEDDYRPLIIEAEEKLGSEKVERLKEEWKPEIREEALKDPQFLKRAARTYVKQAHEPLYKQPSEKKELNKSTQLKDKYLKMVEETFYRIRGWGLPLVMAMGEKWEEAYWYVEAIHNWTNWLLQLEPQSNANPEPPQLEPVKVDERKIIEAEFQVIE